MKEVLLFKLKFCPHCIRAVKWMEEVFREHPEYKDVPLKIIDEGKERKLADAYDYFLVPTFYIGDQKVHEGVASKAIVEKVFSTAYNAK